MMALEWIIAVFIIGYVFVWLVKELFKCKFSSKCDCRDREIEELEEMLSHYSNRR